MDNNWIDMDKVYFFTLYDGSHIRMSIPMHHGELITNRFMPDFLSPSADSPFAHAISGQMALIDPSEFEQDCHSMIAYLNEKRLQTNLDTSYMEALAFTLVSHINRCGRLFFLGLMYLYR